MPAEAVVDASVLAAAFFPEEHSDTARRWLAPGRRLIAPDLLRVEVASIAAKKAWLGQTPRATCDRAVGDIDLFVSDFFGDSALTQGAYALARDHRFSAYDALYLALAVRHDLPVVTFDAKLAARASAANLAKRVLDLGSADV